MLIEQDIIDFCCKYDYDIRKNNNGRWIDQKCAPDVLTIVADCISNYVEVHKNELFSSLDIWHSNYAQENVKNVFKKSNLENEMARNEYDKFFQQPMELFANAKILKKIKKGNRNFYSVNNKEILDYIGLREKNSLIFLKNYIEKVLKDSEIYDLFEEYFKYQTKNAYEEVKRGFSQFIINNTKINGTVECNRIFIKVLNPLAYFKNASGTEKGRMSKQNITYDMLMYNRNNFRDNYAGKPKGVTRKEYQIEHPVEVNNAYYKYQSVKAKRFLKLYNEQYRNNITEHLQKEHIGEIASNIHHIFPEAEFPEISFYLENLIALTPTQHYNYAHNNGHTQEINEQYQHLLLLSKVERIQENFEKDDVSQRIYDFNKLLYVLKVGFDKEEVMEIEDMDFGSVINAININYIA